MGSSRNRLRRLEHAAGCPECALPVSGESGASRIVVLYEDSPEEGLPDDPEERCGSCGRPLWTVLRVVYDSPATSESDTE